MKCLIIGSGGREHALAWKIRESKEVKELYVAPGNGGISEIASLVPIPATEINSLLSFARSKDIDLTVVGPEAPLALGIVDRFEEAGLPIFGPNKRAALLESSKVFAKEMMRKYNVPTASFEVFDDFKKSIEYVKDKGVPIVIKVDGLASGKGVFVCQKEEEEAISALRKIFLEKAFGKSGEKVIIEECLFGEETSIISLVSGEQFLILAPSQDHKRVYDGDKGPNTGGMGAFSPTPLIDRNSLQVIKERIIIPVINGMIKDGIVYKGVLYVGIILTEDGPKVLEFNVRFGDPETQAVFPRLKSELLPVLSATISGELSKVSLSWKEEKAVCVVMVSGGYPGKYEKGKEITGLKEISRMGNLIVFHAGTEKRENKFFTSGGRVLGITGLGKDFSSAMERAYEGTEKIKFSDAYYRKDIGQKAICYLKNSVL